MSKWAGLASLRGLCVANECGDRANNCFRASSTPKESICYCIRSFVFAFGVLVLMVVCSRELHDTYIYIYIYTSVDLSIKLTD